MDIQDLFKEFFTSKPKVEKALGIKPKTLSQYLRDKDRRKMPPDLQIKVLKYMTIYTEYFTDKLKELEGFEK
jgi:hypothetical protein